MEKPPYEFKVITSFSVGKAEEVNPRMNYIRSLTLEIGSSIPNGKYPLVLIDPSPPHNKTGENLSELTSLQPGDIEYIQAFRKPDDTKSARIEIYRKNSGEAIVVKCKQIEGVPGWEKKQDY